MATLPAITDHSVRPTRLVSSTTTAEPWPPISFHFVPHGLHRQGQTSNSNSPAFRSLCPTRLMSSTAFYSPLNNFPSRRQYFVLRCLADKLSDDPSPLYMQGIHHFTTTGVQRCCERCQNFGKRSKPLKVKLGVFCILCTVNVVHMDFALSVLAAHTKSSRARESITLLTAQVYGTKRTTVSPPSARADQPKILEQPIFGLSARAAGPKS